MKRLSLRLSLPVALAAGAPLGWRLPGRLGLGKVEPGGLPQPPSKPKPAKSSKTAKRKPEPEPEPPPPDRSALDAAERALRDLDERRRKEEIALRRRQAALQAEGDKAESGYLEERQKASAALVAAREAYRKAGGRD